MTKDLFGGGFLSPGTGSELVLKDAASSAKDGEAGKAFLLKSKQGDWSWIADATQSQLEAYRQAALTERKAALRKGGLVDVPPEPPSLAQLQQQQTETQRDQKFGSDMDWLDPTFQQKAELLGQSAGSQVKGDAASIAAQTGLLGTAQQFANQNLKFQDPSQQAGLAAQWAAIQGGQGAPQFTGGAQQRAIMQNLLGIQAPQFSGDADQRRVLNQALGMASNTGPGSLQFDTSGRQGEQYGNLKDIIAGGGATAIEMANRQRQRADSEAWLRGQREADMADYAERGLTGSGMELLNLAADRQAAAGRNSMADLDTAKALEERRLGAINSAAGLATNMRGQTIDEQGLLNNRATSGLGAASSVANSMRGANIQEQLGLNEALQNQQVNAAGIAERSRTQDYNEASYLDKRTLDALTQQTDLSTKMRDQLASESIANQNAKQAGLNSGLTIADQMRTSAAQENQYAADSTDLFSRLNNETTNKVAGDNVRFLQDAYKTTQNNRTQTYLGELGLQGQLAAGQVASDVGETKAGYTSGQNTAGLTAEQFNDMLRQYQNLITGQNSAGTADTLKAGQAVADAKGVIGGAAGAVVDTVATAAAGGAGGGGLSALTGAGSTQGSFLPTNYSLDDVKKKVV